MRRFVFLFVLVPIAIVIVVLSVANRHLVTFSIDPFGAALSFTAPLFVIAFAALAVGILIGGIATWFRQGHWRRLARDERAEVDRLRVETARLGDRSQVTAPGLPVARDAA